MLMDETTDTITIIMLCNAAEKLPEIDELTRPLLKKAAKRIRTLSGTLKKLVLCFPDNIPADADEIVFNIPAIIIEEAKKVIFDK